MHSFQINLITSRHEPPSDFRARAARTAANHANAAVFCRLSDSPLHPSPFFVSSAASVGGQGFVNQVHDDYGATAPWSDRSHHYATFHVIPFLNRFSLYAPLRAIERACELQPIFLCIFQPCGHGALNKLRFLRFSRRDRSARRPSTRRLNTLLEFSSPPNAMGVTTTLERPTTPLNTRSTLNAFLVRDPRGRWPLSFISHLAGVYYLLVVRSPAFIVSPIARRAALVLYVLASLVNAPSAANRAPLVPHIVSIGFSPSSATNCNAMSPERAWGTVGCASSESAPHCPRARKSPRSVYERRRSRIVLYGEPRLVC